MSINTVAEASSLPSGSPPSVIHREAVFWGSMSKTLALCPASTRARPRRIVAVVLPEPPFPLQTVIFLIGQLY